MPTPLIGLTTNTSQSDSHTFYVSETYVQAINRAGGAPLLIPNGISEDALAEIIVRLDGILFTGGGDVLPERYGVTNHHNLGEVDDSRDQAEFYLVREIIRQERPFLGICRGIQVINAAMGGTLYVDIGDQLTGAIRHDYHGDYPRSYPAHRVGVKANSRLAGILDGTSIEVNSLHHQGVERLASAFQAVGHAPDGLVEGIELPGYPFGLAVQWHPECMPEVEAMQNLFRAFVQAAEGRER